MDLVLRTSRSGCLRLPPAVVRRLAGVCIGRWLGLLGSSAFKDKRATYVRIAHEGEEDDLPFLYFGPQSNRIRYWGRVQVDEHQLHLGQPALDVANVSRRGAS